MKNKKNYEILSDKKIGYGMYINSQQKTVVDLSKLDIIDLMTGLQAVITDDLKHKGIRGDRIKRYRDLIDKLKHIKDYGTFIDHTPDDIKKECNL